MLMVELLMHRRGYTPFSNSYSLINTCSISNPIEATHPIFARPTSHLPYLSSLTMCTLGGSGAQMLVCDAPQLPQTDH